MGFFPYLPCHIAAAENNVGVLRAMHESSEAVLRVATDEDGWSASHWAATSNAAEALEFLLGTAQLNPNATDNDGSTPLHWAAERNAGAALTTLLAHGADVNALDCNGQTPLYNACMLGNVKAIRLLLDHRDTRVDPRTHTGMRAVDAYIDWHHFHAAACDTDLLAALRQHRPPQAGQAARPPVHPRALSSIALLPIARDSLRQERTTRLRAASPSSSSSSVFAASLSPTVSPAAPTAHEAPRAP